MSAPDSTAATRPKPVTDPACWTGAEMVDRTDWAVTGEVSLQGRAMEIGGIDMKITGGYESGCRNFVLPSRNQREVDRFRKHYADWKALKEIDIHLVDTAAEAAKLILDHGMVTEDPDTDDNGDDKDDC